MRKAGAAIFAAVGFLLLVSAAARCDEGGAQYPFLDTSLPIKERAADLVSRLTLEEKVSLMNEQAEAVPRLGIKKYRYWNEALHGVARSGKYTVFPQAAGMAASWDPALLEKIGTAISDEAWGGINRDREKTGYPPEWHLTFWSPTINMARDPRWGRTPETYGEDPYLTGRLAVGFVRGLQGYDDKYIKVVSTPKHFVANNVEFNRLGGNSVVPERILREYYLQAFRAAVVEGKAQSIMGAYNALNGIPCNANKWLLTDLLRGEWGFDGFVVTDCGAPSHMISQHKYAKDGAEAAAFTVNAGVEIECGSERVLPKYLIEAVQRGLLTEEKIDEAMMYTMEGRMRLGMFDPPEMNPYTKIPPSVVGSEEHKELTRQAVRESVVLLKNEPAAGGKKVLPINKDEIKSVVIIGPYGDKLEYGDYSGDPANEPVTLVDGVRNKAGDKVKIIDWIPTPGVEGYSLVTGKNFVAADGSAGLDAEFFSNPGFEGAPAVKRVDKKLYLKEGGLPEGFGSAPYSVRWSGKVKAEHPGAHIFSVKAKGAARLYVGGKKVLDFSEVKKKEKPKLQSGKEFNFNDVAKRDPDLELATLFMEEGKEYEITLEYVPLKGAPLAKLEWSAPAGLMAEDRKKEMDAIKNADVVLAAVGYEIDDEREGMDRQSFKLPPGEEEYAAAAAELNQNTVALITSGSPVAVQRLEESAPAILLWWYPGEQGGNGVADVLFGDYNPAGRLPFTAYRGVDDLEDFEDYDISKGLTYMYFKGDPLYPFGYGLSYTNFEYSDLKAEIADGMVNVIFKVKNAGGRDGDEVAQVYARDVGSKIPDKPLKKLHGFKRVNIKSGETEDVSISFKVEDLAYWDVNTHGFVVEPGEYEIMVGTSSADIRQRAKITVK